MKDTLVVNLIGASGCGKSKNAWKLGAILKELGIEVELSLEYVKDMVWEGRDAIFDCQAYIFGKQLYKLQRLKESKKGHIDVIITDRPIFLDTVYDPEQHEGFRSYIMFKFNQYNNLNIFLKRGDKFSPNGRHEGSIDESIANDLVIKGMLDKLSVPYIEIDDSEEGVQQILELIKTRLV